MDFEAYRLIQYTSVSDGQTYGSLSNSLNFAAAHHSGDIFRKVVVIHFSELYPEALQDIIRKGPLGLLVVLPESGT